jgi:DNA-binding CsgD family transcriptional regulator
VTGPLLTGNELAVLRGASEGDTYAVIGRSIHATEKSVGNIAMRVVRKLGAANITHAVLLACHAGILDGRPQRHGDHAGYAAHWYRGEEPCEACRAGERAYRNGLKTRTTPSPSGGLAVSRAHSGP